MNACHGVHVRVRITEELVPSSHSGIWELDSGFRLCAAHVYPLSHLLPKGFWVFSFKTFKHIPI